MTKKGKEMTSNFNFINYFWTFAINWYMCSVGATFYNFDASFDSQVLKLMSPNRFCPGLMGSPKRETWLNQSI